MMVRPGRKTGRPRRLDWDAIRTLRATGWTYQEIADVVGCHRTTVLYACDDYFRERKRRRRSSWTSS